MTVTVLLFASYADAFRRPSLTLSLPDGATVGDLMREVRARPEALALPPSPMVAINQCYALAGDTVRDGDEVALIPPVAGG